LTLQPFKQIGILGSGTMGAGIAQLCLQVGLKALLYDIDPTFLEKAKASIESGLKKAIEKKKFSADKLDEAMGNLSLHTSLSELAQCDLIIEAVPESLALKTQLFSQLDELCKPETILASNTSSLSITALGGATKRPGKVAGLHFFNPAPLMKLVEVVCGMRTTEATAERLTAFAENLGKTPVTAKDTPGFIVNRVARPYYGEALKILGESAGNPDMVRTIDSVMREAGGFKMGPFELMDLIGIDVNFAVTQSVWQAYFQLSRYRPHPIQQRMVSAGLLGRKTGEGFYPYES
jgi:3-hydroxybutyryl-CoA dehydrogenase